MSGTNFYLVPDTFSSFLFLVQTNVAGTRRCAVARQTRQRVIPAILAGRKAQRRVPATEVEGGRLGGAQLPGADCATLGFDVRHPRRLKREEMMRSSSSPSAVSQKTPDGIARLGRNPRHDG